MTAERDTHRLTPCPKRPSEQRVTRAAELQFQLQFTAVQEGPRGTGQERWSRLNRSGRPRPELLMRLVNAHAASASP